MAAWQSLANSCQEASFSRLPDPKVSATILLCDSVQLVSGKLYILGGAWTRVVAQKELPTGVGIAMNIVGELKDGQHNFILTLEHGGKPYEREGKPVVVQGLFATTRGTAATSLVPDCNLAIQLAMVFEPGEYVWRLQIDGTEVGSRRFEAVSGAL